MAAAASTLARSRTVGVGPSGMRSYWPDVPKSDEDRRMAYGYNPAVAPRIEPSSAHLTALDQVLGWVSRYLSLAACDRADIASDAGWVAWSRACGMAWPKISDQRARIWRGGAAAPRGNSREAVRRIARAAHEHVARCLQADGVALHVGAVDAPPEPIPIATGRHETMPRQVDTRRWQINHRPCGQCMHISTASDGLTTCKLRGGAVSPGLRAQHPAGAPCWEAHAVVG